MHFKLDENIPLQLKAQINIHDHSVSSVFSEKISGTKDSKLLEICFKNDYVLITLDKDFINVPKQKHKGIIILRSSSQGFLSVSTMFEDLKKKMNLANARNSIIIVEHDHIRIRR